VLTLAHYMEEARPWRFPPASTLIHTARESVVIAIKKETEDETDGKAASGCNFGHDDSASSDARRARTPRTGEGFGFHD